MSAETRTQGTVCCCDPADGSAKTYYVWSSLSDEKQRVTEVAEVYVTQSDIVFETCSHQTVRVPRSETFMVTCELCSPPPFC